ncbi:MAG: HD-GYP domain-containing protein [Desulfobacterales bacterium]|nr:HD-GYP domain-containing protein [Desulfobacterales bacterium]MDX2512249.1 HD-GYP domain-containing protein [Desulfobacterales bacterium]
MEIFELQAFLTNLAPISRMQYQIWDREGKMIFPLPAERPPEPRLNDALQKFVGILAEQNIYRQGYFADQYFLCGLPLTNGQGKLGVLVAYGPKPDRQMSGNSEGKPTEGHSPDMKKFLGSLASILQANWLAKEEIQELAEELEQSFEDLHMYGKITSKIKALRFSSHMLIGLITDLLNNLRADAAFALFPDIQNFNALVTKPHLEGRLKTRLEFYQELIGHIPGDAVSSKEKYFIINDSNQDASFKKLHPDPYRFLGVMVAHDDNFFGWLGLVSFNMKEIYRQGELRLMVSLAEQLSVVIANTGLYQDLEQFIINMVKSLVFAIEAKDPYTRGHSERVSKVSMRLGEQLGLKGADYDRLRWSSILHDIGKIGIPEEILDKPSPLTDEEFDLIKEHPAKGFEILQPLVQLEGSLPGILHHHERFDGKGYPGGLKGEKIPFNARIIAVADTYDAVSSTRAYRAANSTQKAMVIIKEVAGSQLDPQVVAALVEITDKDGRLLENTP